MKQFLDDGIVLQGILGEIEEVAGLDAAVKLAGAVGGGRAYFPQVDSLSDGHWLVELVGLEAASAICALCGGGNVEIPAGPASGRIHLWLEMRKSILAGESSNSIAQKLKISTRTVKRMRAALAQAEMNPPSVTVKSTRGGRRAACKAVKAAAILSMPNLGISEIADRVGASPNYIHRVRREARRAEAARLGKVRVK